MDSSLKVPLRHWNWVEGWTLTESLQHLESFLFQSFCCRFAGVFGIIVLLYEPVTAGQMDSGVTKILHTEELIFSEHCTVWPWVGLAKTSTPVKTKLFRRVFKKKKANWRFSSKNVNILSQCRIMDSISFGNGLITLPDWWAATIASLRSLLMSFLLGTASTHTWMLQSSKLTKLLLL